MRVVDKFLMQLEEQLHEKKVEAMFTARLKEHLAKKGFDPLMGARPMARLIQDTIRRALADELLFGKLAQGGKVTIDVGEDENIVLRFEEEAARAICMAGGEEAVAALDPFLDNAKAGPLVVRAAGEEGGEAALDVLCKAAEREKLQKVDTIVEIIREHLRKKDTADVEEVVSDASSYGIEEREARRIIDQLKSKGTIYEKGYGQIKLVE